MAYFSRARQAAVGVSVAGLTLSLAVRPFKTRGTAASLTPKASVMLWRVCFIVEGWKLN